MARDAGADEMLRLVVLAFAAKNVRIEGARFTSARERLAIAATLLQPGGNPAPLDPAEIRKAAAAMLLRVLAITGPNERFRCGSGAAAEWIGAAIGAAIELPRFDDEEFLKTVAGDELRKAAADAGMKSSGSVGALRQTLVGNLPDWRPSAAVFGAPAPSASDVEGAFDADEDEPGIETAELENAA